MRFYAPVTDAVSEEERVHSDIVRQGAGECVVVLKNDGTLPLSGKGKIALYGDGARHTVKGGTGSGDVNTRSVTSIEQGLINAGFEITTSGWLDRYDVALGKLRKEYLEHIRQKSIETGLPEPMVMFADTMGTAEQPPVTPEDIEGSGTDTAVYVLSRDSGEGGDRYLKKGDYLIRDDELSNIKIIADSYSRMVVLLNVGGVIDVKPIADIEGVNSILHVSQLGNMTGDIVTDVLLGISDPSGRLTDTWPEKYEDIPFSSDFSHNNGNTDDEYYREGIYVGYRYFDTFGKEPFYPFGFGLGYTTFDISCRGVTVNGTIVTVSAEVTNTGKHKGRETLQVYVSSPRGVTDKPYQELRAYKKTGLLAPGQSETVEASFDIRDCASYDTARASYVLDGGSYIVRAGKHSRDTSAAAVLELPSEAVVRKCRNLFGESGITDELDSLGITFDEDLGGVKRIQIDPSCIETEEVIYHDERPLLEDKRSGEHLTFDDVLEGRATVEELAAQLSVPQMSKLAVGAYESDALIQQNVVGSASLLVPGAAAETTDKFFEDRRIPLTILADGPAGLRLQPHFLATAEGERIFGGEVFGTSFNPFPDDLPEDTVHYYQYCTAIPIATALAQSWNTGFIEECGKVVGEEMKKYYVHFWLAPGMNIHRNPLCGRNFEYYSEDPLVAGYCAAYDTKGVQSVADGGTTIKHYACNNQEDNRLYSNSHVTEKALRELYLRGFGIAIREAQPLSIMTSYNLINGIHAANNYDLIQSAARDEFGFEGVVMTDWYTSQEAEFMGPPSDIYPCSSSPMCIHAGNDLQMPGCEKNVTDIIEAVGNGELPLADLQFCTVNILKSFVRIFGR